MSDWGNAGMEWRLFGLAAAIRVIFLRFTNLPGTFENRIELANTQIGIKSVREAIFLISHSIPIYQNKSICQPSPLIVNVVGFFHLLKIDDFLFVLLDLIAGLLIWRIMERLQARVAKKKLSDDVRSDYDPFWTCALYLFHPFSILTCLSRSSALFNTVSYLSAFYFALNNNRRLSMFMLALATILSIYPVALLIPLAMLLAEGVGTKKRRIIAATWNYCSFLLLWVACSWAVSSIPAPTMGNLWEPLKDFCLYATPIGCNCLVSDLRPNVGLAWYLFVEMFDHFRSFFLTVFQLNMFIYLVPAAIKFRSDPIILSTFLVAVPSIFKPYPTLADSVLLLVFVSFVGQGILRKSIVLPIYLFAMIAFSLLGPINWHYWIQQGSGNANFYYAITLLYNGSHIFLVLDVLHQWFRRDIARRNPEVALDGMFQY